MQPGNRTTDLDRNPARRRDVGSEGLGDDSIGIAEQGGSGQQRDKASCKQRSFKALARV